MRSSLPLAKQLEAEIEFQLSQPPSRAGRRLKTVRELARIAGTSHFTVYRSLVDLVERGVLTRKRGSGIYVRKMPSVVPPPPPSNGAGLFRSESIFAEDPPQTRKRAKLEAARLLIDLWWDTLSPGKSAQLLQRGITDQAREQGHRLRLRKLSVESNGAPSHAEPTPGCDGNIVLVKVAETFHRITPANRPPTVYLWGGNASPEYQPLVEIDMESALERAVCLLAREGHERIALLGWSTEQSRMQRVYDRTLRELGQSYRRAEYSDSVKENDAAAVRRLFAGAEAPQALYVTDDIMTHHILPVLRSLGREPGRNLAMITHANYGSPLPAGIKWSRLEFDPYSVGRLAMQSLARDIESSGDDLLSFTHRAAWWPGKTHFRTEPEESGK
jgi:DNA-binding LacI/PurR family transcriptional regulator